MTTEEKAQAVLLVEKFNRLYPVGSKVKLRLVAHPLDPIIECTVRYPGYIMKGGEPVAFFNEISGCFSIEPDFIQYP
jgi:hypothetical protein